MENRKNTFWRVPVYCIVIGWIAFQLNVRFFGKFAIVTFPDGSISSDTTKWIILSGIVFFVTIIFGGVVFFSKMTKREVFYSASIMVVLNVIWGLVAYKTQGMFSFLFAEVSEWSSFISQLLYGMNLNQWVGAIVTWLAPYLFILFGKNKSEKNI